MTIEENNFGWLVSAFSELYDFLTLINLCNSLIASQCKCLFSCKSKRLVIDFLILILRTWPTVFFFYVASRLTHCSAR